MSKSGQSEIERNAEKIRAIVKGCSTVAQAWKKLGWRDVQAVHSANKLLGLGLTPAPDDDDAALDLVLAKPKGKESDKK